MLVPAVHGRHSVVGISIWLVVLVTYSKVQYEAFFSATCILIFEKSQTSYLVWNIRSNC